MILGFIIRIALLMLGLAACFAILNYFVKGSKNRVSGKGAAPLEESKESKDGSALKGQSFPEGSATEAAASAILSTLVSSSIETGDASIDATEDPVVVVDEEIAEVIKDDDEDEDAAAGEEKEEDEEKTKATSES